MRSVKVHWAVSFKQKQWLPEEVFWNIIDIQTYNWTKFAFCESTLSGGLQAEALGFRRSSSKHPTHSNIQLNNVCALWKYKVHWVVGFKQKQWVSEEVLQNIIHIQTYNWTNYAFCESKLSGGLQAEAMGFRRSFSKQYTHSNIQLNKVCILWKYTEWWASSRSNGFQKKFFSKHYTHSNIQLNKVCALWKYTEWWASSRSNGFQKKNFWNTIYIQTYNWTMYALCEKTLSGGLQAEAMGFRRSFAKHYTRSNIQLNKLCKLWK